MENNEVQLKRCPKCGTERPTTEFYASSSTSDGLSTYCKECKREMSKRATALRRVKSQNGLNPELAAFQPRELIAELRARGYYGELKYIHTIKV